VVSQIAGDKRKAGRRAWHGNVAALQEHYEQAGQFLLEVIVRSVSNNDLHSAQMAARNFCTAHKQAGADVRAKLKAMWENAGLGAFS